MESGTDQSPPPADPLVNAFPLEDPKWNISPPESPLLLQLLESGYMTDYEITGDDPIFNDYGSRIQDNDEIPPEEYDLTCQHPGQHHWSSNNLPDILYVLQPREEDAISQEEPRLIERFPEFSNHLARDYDVLPYQISSKVEGWRVISWLRMDGRIRIRDIVDRINPDVLEPPQGYSRVVWYTSIISRVALRCKQSYRDFNIVRWWDEDTTHLNKVKELLKEAGISAELNTTRGITPGLVDPARGESAGRVPFPSNHRTYETVFRPPPPPPPGPVPNFPEYPPLPGEEEDEEPDEDLDEESGQDSINGNPKEEHQPSQENSNVIYSDPTNTYPPVDPALLQDITSPSDEVPLEIRRQREFQERQAMKIHGAPESQDNTPRTPRGKQEE